MATIKTYPNNLPDPTIDGWDLSFQTGAKITQMQGGNIRLLVRNVPKETLYDASARIVIPHYKVKQASRFFQETQGSWFYIKLTGPWGKCQTVEARITGDITTGLLGDTHQTLAFNLQVIYRVQSDADLTGNWIKSRRSLNSPATAVPDSVPGKKAGTAPMPSPNNIIAGSPGFPAALFP